MGQGILLTIIIVFVLLPCISSTWSDLQNYNECNLEENQKDS